MAKSANPVVSLLGMIASVALIGSVVAQVPEGAAPSAENGTASVRAFLERYCVRCHGAKRQKGGVKLNDLGGAAGFVGELERWGKVHQVLATGEMPPTKSKQPQADARQRVIDWIEQQLRATNRESEWTVKQRYPEYGNFVGHERLFSPSRSDVAYTESRLWKRSPYQFESQITRGIGLGKGRHGRPSRHLVKVKQPFAIEDKAGIKDFAAVMRADSATLATLMRNAGVIVDKHLEGALHALHVREHGETPVDQLPKDKRGRPIRKRPFRTHPVFASIATADDPPPDEAMDAAIHKTFDLLIEREPTVEEVARYRAFMRSSIATGGNAEGLRLAMMAVALSPQAVYRMELGQGDEDEHGRRMLGSINLAYALSYALTDERPDAELMRAAKGEGLRSRAAVEDHAERIWDDAAIDKPRILRFFREFFGYHHAPQVFKDDARFGKNYTRGQVAERLVTDADVLVMHIVKEDRDVLARLLTTEEYFVAHSGDNEQEGQSVADLARFYDYFKKLSWKRFPYQTPKEHAQHARSISRMFAHPNGNVVKGWMRYLTQCDENGITPIPDHRGREYIRAYDLDVKSFDYPAKQPFVLAKGKRAGLLMHPAWLIAHSLNLDNDPVRRGKWVRERLLAGTVPEVPINVDARIPEDKHLSLRERFAVTRGAECWRCHVKMNPLGMPFEAFDDFGRWRRVERLHAKGKTKPVDASGELRGTGDPELDAAVSGPLDLVRRLARSERARQSFVRHAFRYFLGRNERPRDAATLVAADRVYVENGGSFRALVLSLLTSDSFLYRKFLR